MTPNTDVDREDLELKARHRAMWALGDYPTLASDLISSLGPALVAATGVAPGARVLDIAAGSGNAAIPAALAGAVVTASDLTPELFDAGRRRAAQQDVDLQWEVADAEKLPFGDKSFDVALSCVGIMFAPYHQRSADELIRVLRPGGRIGLLSWTPTGFIGQLFAAMKPFAAPPPTGAQAPPLWGDEVHVRGLLGDRVRDVVARRESVSIRHFIGPQDFRRYFASHYGPTISTYARIGAEPERVAELDSALDALAATHVRPDGSLEWEYLLLTATRD